MVGPHFGGRLGRSHAYLVGSLSYLNGGSRSVRDPNSRTTLANPADPFGLTSIVEATDVTSPHGIVPALELRYSVAPWLQLDAGIMVPVVFMNNSRSVSERLLFPNGDLADENHYGSSSLDTRVLGGGMLGLNFLLGRHFDLGFRCSAAGNAGGDAFIGCGATLGYAFGGSDTPARSSSGPTPAARSDRGYE